MTRDAVLLVNLGTPDEPTRGAVARYLREFLSDPRVVDLPRWLWLPLLYGVIVPIRASRSARAYRKVWTEQGSPLLVQSERLAEGLQQALGDRARVALAMRYGQPSVLSALTGLEEAGVERLLVVPMYPQYSRTTSETVFDAVTAGLERLNWSPEVIRLDQYHERPDWVGAIAASVRDHQSRHGTAERLLISMHGIPERYDKAGDPYAGQCCESAVEISKRLGLAPGTWKLTFQSRLGREPWLRPYTDVTLAEWAAEGVKSVQVICPGFAVDCLETLEEIAMENAEDFEAAGGEHLDYIPCLNDSPAHVAVYQAIVEDHLAPLPVPEPEPA